ncbi:hypothetical protein M434DRAFT_186371 [Hypoxylon sp. CO27-5]|nr:hypothetical protein M434DRAFT_186371 [Hypoxylon sp. CO27-5]
MSDACAECMLGVVFRIFFTGAVILIDKLIVQRRPSIVHLVRQLQNIIHLPKCMHIVASTDPGMGDEDLRLAAQFLGLGGFFAMFGWIRALDQGIFWDSLVLGLAFGVPGCLTVVVWIMLVLARRRLVSRASYPSIGYGSEEKGTPPNETNRGLERSIQAVWADAWLTP